MRPILKYAIFTVLALCASLALGGRASAAEKRVALVIGNGAYESRPLETAANDAGLVAQTLQAAGFDVTGARDLDEDSLRHALRDFADKVSASGPDTVAFVYFAGYGLQLEGENYLIPIGANIARDADIPSRATRVSDYVKALAASGLKTGVVVLDAARANPFTLSGAPLASGLALQEPGPRMILAFNTAPGTIARVEKGPYGAYAHALSEMIREGGLPVKGVFDNVRLRVNETTKGAEIPWNSPGAEASLVFFERSANAPPAPDQTGSVNKPIAELGPKDGYAAAIQRDTLQGYEDYVASYPHDPSAKRVRALAAVRREAMTWRRTRIADSPNAYWSYLRRYPRGPHVGDARRRLAQLAAAYDPPPSFEMIDYDVPPPPEDEIIYVDRPVVVFDDPVFGFVPPPPPPVYFLPPPPPDFVVLAPPVIIAEPYALPVPVFVPIPVWQQPPPYIAPPPNNVIFANIHNQVIVDNSTNNFVVKDTGGQLLSSGALKAAGVGAAALAVGAALPAFVAKKAAGTPPGAGAVNPAALQGAPGAQTLAPGAAAPPGQVPAGAAPLGAKTPIAPGANPAATLHTLPNASPLPTPDKTLGGKTPAGPATPGAPASVVPGANPSATLHTAPNAAPLPTPGAQPLNKTLSGKPPAGGAPGGAPALGHVPRNVSPLGGSAPPGNGPATTHLAPDSPPRHLAPPVTHSPAPMVHRPPPPPPTAAIHQPPPQFRQGPPPGMGMPQPQMRAPPPAAMHAPAPAFRAPPAPAAARAPAPAPAKHCTIVNGAPVCK